MKKISILLHLIIAFLLTAQTAFSITKHQYETGLFEASIKKQDLSKKVKTKKSRSLKKTLKTLRSIKGEIHDAARKFGISPAHIIGVIAAEHALNVDWVDALQNVNLQRRMTGQWVDQAADNALFAEMQKTSYKKCKRFSIDYRFWYCVVNTWYTNKFGKVVRALTTQNKAYKSFTSEYFNPNGVGKTFGLGQLSPLRALMVSDMVSRANRRISRISFRQNGNSYQAYSDILDPKKVVYYTAATIRKSIDAYKQIARFDISNNPGVVATLYNIGNESFHASNRRRENLKRIRNGKDIQGPYSNAFGRWVAQHQDLIDNAL